MPSLLSVRFLALPAVALAVIVALANAHGDAWQRESGVTIVRAANCAAPARLLDARCALAGGDDVVMVR